MIRSDEYWLDIEERKARGDLRAYGLGDWLRIVFLMNVAQLLLAVVVVGVVGVGGLAIASGVVGRGSVADLDHVLGPMAVAMAPSAPEAVGADAACRAFCDESRIEGHALDPSGSCLCVDAVGNVVMRGMPAPP